MLTPPQQRRRAQRRQSSQHAGDVFHAVADPTRRALLDMLAEGEEPVNSLAQRFAMSRPAISQHLAILLKTRLVRARRVGRERRYRLQPQPLEKIYGWIALYECFWTNKRNALSERLRKPS